MEEIDFYINRYSLKKLGNIIGSGATTVVIKVNEAINSSNIENAVLHITREPQKFDYLSTLFKNTSLEIELFDIEKAGTEYKKLFNKLKKEGLYLYFTTEMSPQKREDHRIILNSAMDDVSTFFRKKRFTSESLPVKDIMIQLRLSINEFTDKMDKVELIIVNAIENGLKAISMTDGLEDFKLDLHSQQFCSYNGELFCIDPIYFGESN